MIISSISEKLLKEMIRIGIEHDSKVCSVPMLISALYAVRGNEHDDFTNLFHVYFEKKLGIQPSVIESVEEFCRNNNCEKIIPDYFTIVLFATESSSLRVFLKKISANFMEASNFFNSKKILGYEIVPYEISSFVTYRNPEAIGKTCKIVGRDDVINSIYRIMLKSSKRNVIIYGDAGVGKSAVGEKLIHEIANGTCPNRFSGFKVFEMSVKDFILNCEDSKKANEKMNFLMDFLSKREDDIILLIDEIQTILGKDGFFDSKKLDLSTTLKPVLARGEIRIIGITTQTDYITSFASDPTLSRRFEGVEIKQPRIKEVSTMITPRLREMERVRGVKIDSEMVEKAIWYAACFEFSKSNPDKSIDVIDRAMANAEMENRKFVSKEDIIKVFEVSFRQWNGMSEFSKRNTAYHEAGHYVLNRITNPGNYVTLAVSIMPTEDYGGINVMEYNEEVTPTTNRQYFIESIACELAGRAAEELVSGEVNSGAADDLDSATEIAEEMIKELGMSTRLLGNRSYFLDDITEECTAEIEKEVNNIIEESYGLCKKLLEENHDFLDAIAKALLEKQILMKSELDSIWSATLKKRAKTDLAKKKGFSEKSAKQMLKETIYTAGKTVAKVVVSIKKLKKS